MTAIKCLILFFGGLGLFLLIALSLRAVGITLDSKAMEFLGMASFAIPYYYMDKIYNWMSK